MINHSVAHANKKRPTIDPYQYWAFFLPDVVQILMLRQSSLSGAVILNGILVAEIPGRDGHDGPNALAVIAVFWFGSLTGGAKRSGPAGGLV